MNHPRIARALRITWTALCGIACVLLCVLWVRSHSWIDQATIRVTHSQSLDLILIRDGIRFVGRYNLANPDPNFWSWDTLPLSKIQSIAFAPRKVWDGRRIDWGDTSRRGFNEVYVLLPYWLLVSAMAAFAAVPWLKIIPSRFNLRTLLLAMTLVALVLGRIVWLR